MEIHVDVIEEKSYIVKIDVPEEKEDNLFDELSCEPCMEDIGDEKNIAELKRGGRGG